MNNFIHDIGSRDRGILNARAREVVGILCTCKYLCDAIAFPNFAAKACTACPLVYG